MGPLVYTPPLPGHIARSGFSLIPPGPSVTVLAEAATGVVSAAIPSEPARATATSARRTIVIEFFFPCELLIAVFLNMMFPCLLGPGVMRRRQVTDCLPRGPWCRGRIAHLPGVRRW